MLRLGGGGAVEPWEVGWREKAAQMGCWWLQGASEEGGAPA